MVTSKQRFETLDGLRGVAALAVMFGHFAHATRLDLLAHANTAVDLFFCLSGLVLAGSYQARLGAGLSLRDFLLRRLVRLYPMFLLGLALGCAALLVKIAAGQTDLGYADALAATGLNAVYLPYLGAHFLDVGRVRISDALFPGDGPAWSLLFELSVNVVFALWAARRPRPRLWPLLAVAALASLLYARLTYQTGSGWASGNVLGGIPRALFGFFAGVCLFAQLGRLRRWLPDLPPALLTLATLAMFAMPIAAHEATLWFAATLLLVPLLVALGAVATPRSAAGRRAAGYAGWLSYPIYCLHYPVYLLATAACGMADLPVWVVLAGPALSAMLAHLAGTIIDAPARAWLAARIGPAAQRDRNQTLKMPP